MSPPTIAFDGEGVDLDRDAFLSGHDVVYLSPAVEGYEGFPVGNGDLGAMAWTPPDRLALQINKINTWDDAPRGLFEPWEDARNPEKSELFTALRSCGELRIEPGLPVFDWMYLDDFEGRLSLADACASWHASGPLGSVSCSVFVAADPAVVALHYEDNLAEPVVRRVVLARWGSRVFEHWYRFVRREFLVGPEPARADCDGDEVWVQQRTRSLHFAMAGKLVGPDTAAVRINSREAGYFLETGTRCAFDMFIAAVTSEEAEDPLAEARRRVREAAETGRSKVFAVHRKAWSHFWKQSFVHIPDDYLENLWYLNAYQVASAARGEYPPHFIGSLWSWNRDCRPWNHFYHWNQQQYTWPLHASGHAELMLPYAKWKLEGLDGARQAARHAHGCDGAFYSDVSNRRGDQGVLAAGIAKNLGGAAMTAMDLLRHYEFTLDKGYLETYAYPVLREVVRFYIGILEKWDDGRYHVPEALPNESPISCLSSDTSSDLAGIRKLFPAFVEVAGDLDRDCELLEQAKEIVENLADFVLTKVPETAITWGDVPVGAPIVGFGTLLSTGLPGHPWSERPYWKRDAAMDFPCSYHAVNAQATPIFPAGLIDLGDAGTPLFEACRNAALCFDPVSANGHSPLPICLARLGLGDMLPAILDEWIDRYQHFSQGLFCYFQRDYRELFEKGNYGDPSSASEHRILDLTNDVKVQFSDPEERVGLLRRPFAHVGLEPGSVLETTVNEMLLHSHGGAIRVFPAIPGDWDCCFTLHAVGAFVVTSEHSAGETAYVAVRSLKGRPCRVVNPWSAEDEVRVRIAAGEEVLPVQETAGVLAFATEPGRTYIIERASLPTKSFAKLQTGGIRNTDTKAKGAARLGIPRRF